MPTPDWFKPGAEVLFRGLGSLYKVESIDIEKGSWIGSCYGDLASYPIDEVEAHWEPVYKSDEGLTALIKWRDDLHDAWGEEGMLRTCNSLARWEPGLAPAVPEELMPAMKRFQSLSERAQLRAVQRVYKEHDL